MKFLKILAAALAICCMGTMFIACDKGGDKETTAETTAATVAKVNVTLKIKDGSTEYKSGSIACDGTLRDAIELFCAAEGFEGEAFDTTGLLKTIGELTAADGKMWTAYDESKGKDEAFESLGEATVTEGQTIVIVLE